MQVLREIWETVRRHKLRTAITGFSVAWGIFLLVILLAVGNGLGNGVSYQFRDDATNSLSISPGKTMFAHKGLPVGRAVNLTNDDIALIERHLPDVEYTSGRVEQWGAQYVTYGDKSAGFSLRGLHPGHRFIENTEVRYGRYINQLDIDQKRKVTVIGKPVADFFFPSGSALGKSLNVNGIVYQVVGVFFDSGGDRENRMLHIPITTAQIAYNKDQNIDRILFTLKNTTLEKSQLAEKRVRQVLAKKHGFRQDDPKAIYVRNNYATFIKYFDLIVFIKYFVGFIGIMTLIAGVVGVGNILLITVKERTKEFGIRRAIGATGGSIIKLILLESIIITLFSGYLGLLAGIGLLEVINGFMPKEGGMFSQPDVALSVVLSALGVLVFTGALTGVLPAYRAVSVHPIEALRNE